MNGAAPFYPSVPWSPDMPSPELADVDPSVMASMPPPMMTANPALSDVPLYQPTQDPVAPNDMVMHDALPLNPNPPMPPPMLRRPAMPPPPPPKANPVVEPVQGGISKMQKETEAAQTDMLKLQKDREKIASDQEQAAFQHAQAIGMQNAATLAETHQQDRQIAAHDAMAERQSTDELNALRSESNRVANMHVDPTRILPKTVLGSVFGAIGAAIGAGAQALTGHNSFQEIVTTAIDRDIDAQKANVQGAQAGLSRRTNMYSLMRQKFGDDRAAMVATKDAYLSGVDRWLAGLQAQATTRQGAAKFQDMRAVLGQERDQLQIGFQKEKRAELAAAAAAQLAAQQRLLAESHWQQEHKLKEREVDAKAGEGPGGQKDLMSRYSAAAGGVLPRSAGAEEFEKRAQAFGFIQKELADMKKVAARIGAGDKLKPWDSATVKELRRRAMGIVPLVTQAFGSGTPQAFESQTTLEGIVADPKSFFDTDSKQSLDLFDQRVGRGLQSMREGSGVVPAKKIIENGRERVVLTGDPERSPSSSHGFQANIK